MGTWRMGERTVRQDGVSARLARGCDLLPHFKTRKRKNKEGSAFLQSSQGRKVRRQEESIAQTEEENRDIPGEGKDS